MRVAVVQFEIAQFQPEKNLIKAERFIKEASERGANIVVFPEDFITGPIGSRLEEFADSEHKYRKHFQKLAKEYKIDIASGSIIEKDKLNYYNTAYYINSSGKIKAKYRKMNLWHPERRYLTPGEKISVFNTKYGKIGLIICWDIFFPEVFREMVKKGVKTVICPSYWCDGDGGVGLNYDKKTEMKLVNSISIARAFENEIAFVYCNAAGKLVLPNFKSNLLGYSQITVPFKGAINKLENNKEEMFIQDIDLNILRDAERAYGVRWDLKNMAYLKGRFIT